MRNVTISLPDEVYRKARIAAAEQDRSLSALVRELLTDLSRFESDFERREQLQDEVLEAIETFRAGDRLTRDQVHRREVR